MAFGLRNAAQSLQRLKDNILMGLDFILSFLDDDGVFSKSADLHWQHLRTLFVVLAANGLALNLAKCVFAVAELDFLGHRISAAGVHPLRDNVQVILDFPPPPPTERVSKGSWVWSTSTAVFSQGWRGPWYRSPPLSQVTLRFSPRQPI